MKNKYRDLNNHLFAQLERINEESLSGDKLKEEIERSKAIGGIAREIIAAGKLVLDAQIACKEYNIKPASGLLTDGVEIDA